MTEPKKRDSLKEIILKIEKLRNLGTSSNKHEAAAALARAAELMLRYQIEEADLNVNGEDAELKLDEYPLFEHGNHFCEWKTQIAFALGDCFRCKVFLLGKKSVRIYGSRNDSITVNYIYQLIVKEVDEWTDVVWLKYGKFQKDAFGQPYNGKSWKHSFRLGVVTEVCSRLNELYVAITKDYRDSHAMVVYDQKHVLIDTWCKSVNMKTMKSTSTVKISSAFQDGQKTGKYINIGNDAHGLLKAPVSKIENKG